MHVLQIFSHHFIALILRLLILGLLTESLLTPYLHFFLTLVVLFSSFHNLSFATHFIIQT